MQATFIQRLKAFFIDYLFILAYLFLILVLSLSIPAIQQLFQGSPYVAQLTGFLLVTLPVSLYFIVLDSGKVGQTIGKKKMRLRVVDLQGKPLTIYRSALRVALKFLPWELSHFLTYRLVYVSDENPELYLIMIGIVIYGLMFVYIVTAIFTKRRQSLYDFLCGAQVVKK